jgi:hypothetical protein
VISSPSPPGAPMCWAVLGRAELRTFVTAHATEAGGGGVGSAAAGPLLAALRRCDALRAQIEREAQQVRR